MRSDFSEHGASIWLEPREYGFVFRCLSDRIETLPRWEVEARLGMTYEEARLVVDGLVRSEREARESGTHWMPPLALRPEEGSEQSDG